MSQGLNQFKGAELELVVARRFNSTVKGLGYWGAYDKLHPTKNDIKVKISKSNKVVK